MRHCTARYSLLPIFAALGIALLAASTRPAQAQGPATIYQTTFEEPEFVADVPLVFQDGWVGVPPLSPLAAVVSTDKPRQGKQSVRVWGGDLVPQGFINEATNGYYDAIGSYRKPINFDTGGVLPVRLSAHIRVDGPLTPGDNFFSAALSARAVIVNADGVVNTIGIGQIDLSSDGFAYGHDGNENVPSFQASVPIALGEWHTVAIVLDFASQTYALSVDDQSLGTYPFPDPEESFPGEGFVTTDTLSRGALLTFTAPDTEETTKDAYSATYDKFSIAVFGGGKWRKNWP